MDTDVLVQNMCIWNLDYHKDPDLLEDQYSANPVAALCTLYWKRFYCLGALYSWVRRDMLRNKNTSSFLFIILNTLVGQVV